MINKNVLVGFVLAVVLVVVGFVAGWNIAKDSSQPSQEPLRDTIVKVDTMSIIMPADTITHTIFKPVHVHDTSVIVQNDSVFVMLPYEQHHFSMSDTLDLWYSGVDARVDSLRFYLRSTTIEVVKEQPRKWFALYGGADIDWAQFGTAYKMYFTPSSAKNNATSRCFPFFIRISIIWIRQVQ